MKECEVFIFKKKRKKGEKEMKRVFVTTCAVLFAAVAAGAQSWGTAGDINRFGEEYLRQNKSAKQRTAKKEAKQVGSLEKAIAQANIKHNRQMFVMGSLGDAALYAQNAPYTSAATSEQAASKPASKTPAKTQAKEEKSSPAYYPYAGREGKVIAMGEMWAARIQERREARQEEAQKASAPAPAPAPAAKKEKKQKGSWLGALFGGRYPGESDEDFAFRLQMRTHPSCQPFK